MTGKIVGCIAACNIFALMLVFYGRIDWATVAAISVTVSALALAVSAVLAVHQLSEGRADLRAEARKTRATLDERFGEIDFRIATIAGAISGASSLANDQRSYEDGNPYKGIFGP